MPAPLPPSTPTGPSVPVPAYQLTSQYASWSFSPSTLSALRQAAYSSARARLAAQWAAELRLSPSTSEPEYPSKEELELLVTSYLAKLRGLTKVLGVPEVVEEYAASYLKRYYVRRSELEGDVRGVMLTCVYLALKSTSHALPLSRFAALLAGRGPNARAVASEIEGSVRGLEFGVADELGWELCLHTSGEALKGVVLDLQTLEPSPLPLLRKLLPRAQSLLSTARLTRLELSYSASHIALACLRASGSAGGGEGDGGAGEKEAQELVGRWLEVKEERARRAKENRRKEKEEWLARETQRRSKNGEGDKAEPSSSAAAAALDVSAPLASPLGLSIPSILALLDDITATIFADERTAAEAKAKAPEGSKGPFAVDIEEVRSVDVALKRCADPEGVEGTALYKRKRAAEESALAAKRAKKASAVAAASSSGADPFGSEPLGLAPALGAALGADAKDKRAGGGLFGGEMERRKIAKEKESKGEKGEEEDSDDDVPLLPGAVQK